MVERCARCGLELCLEHQPMPGKRCERCELAYEERRGELHLRALFGLAVAAALLANAYVVVEVAHEHHQVVGGFRSFSTGVPALDTLLIGVFLSYWVGRFAVTGRTAILRRGFLREHPARR
jgi:hypothetical protein